jgi:CCR4-NOT transcription complex subunit 1
LRNVKFDSIPEMGPIPPILSDFTSGLKSGDLRSYLDQYLLNRGTPSFLPSLKDRLKLSGPDGSTETYNLPLINSLVMYIGVSSVAQAKARSGSSLFVASDDGVVALQYLATNLDVEGLSLCRRFDEADANVKLRPAPSPELCRTAPPIPKRPHSLV